jgi:hypothetical protein
MTRASNIGGVNQAVVILVALLSTVVAASNAPDKPHTVDSGTFAILVNGQRVGTETFHIEQGPAVSTASSEFKAASGDKASQKAELQITASGDLLRYEWREMSPGKSHILVEPTDQFILEHIVPNPPARPIDQPFLLPASTMILDDYFFSHREILLWRYLAAACAGNLQKCQPGRTSFGVLVPSQHVPEMAVMEFAGTEKVQTGPGEHLLSRFNLKVGDDPEWTLYMDENLKLVRIVIAAEKTEVVRE